MRTVHSCTVQTLAAYPLAVHLGGVVGRDHHVVKQSFQEMSAVVFHMDCAYDVLIVWVE